MEAAGALAAREIHQSYLPELARQRLALVCGPGNNGGDGFVVARHLYAAGFYSLQVYTWAPAKQQTALYKLQKERAQAQGLRITDLEQEPDKISELSRFGIVVDALFGIGLSREINQKPAEIVGAINSGAGAVISLDIPSGISSLTGNTLGVAVRASMTLTFGLAKPGLYIGDGPSHSGKIRILQIGFPRQLFRQIAQTHFAFNERLARRWLPVRKERSNKSDHGHLLVVAGSAGMWGAAQLACEAAYRIGSGYVTLAVSPEEAKSPLANQVGAEVLIASRTASNLLEKKTAVVIGPGSGKDEQIKDLILSLKKSGFSQVVLDADGLSVLSGMKGQKLLPQWVLTPHSGELARLLNTTSDEIEVDRPRFALEAAKKFGCMILLKGYRSLLANHEGRLAVIISGNASLAKAGTGDVLSGFIGGLMAQGVGALQAAGTGAYFHGRLSDEWIRLGRDAKSLMPRDLLALAPELLSQLSREI